MNVSRVKDTHRKNTPSSKTQVLTKSINLYIWEIGTLQQLFLRGFYDQIEVSKR